MVHLIIPLSISVHSSEFIFGRRGEQSLKKDAAAQEVKLGAKDFGYLRKQRFLCRGSLCSSDPGGHVSTCRCQLLTTAGNHPKRFPWRRKDKLLSAPRTN
ncbi:hypothetical protein BRADI_3g37041v3 [Brachypodium distachyon]|uniref:Uncharacterized protein n=1 Tax=Brachypodium distachyon TaxID=15368 RepID=A0A2K2D1P9_BRADI|nr:hypothetical protein BRADI_3g37041v3 [Brachypodium distachyon]